jgi:hypothetical protein
MSQGPPLQFPVYEGAQGISTTSGAELLPHELLAGLSYQYASGQPSWPAAFFGTAASWLAGKPAADTQLSPSAGLCWAELTDIIASCAVGGKMLCRFIIGMLVQLRLQRGCVLFLLNALQVEIADAGQQANGPSFGTCQLHLVYLLPGTQLVLLALFIASNVCLAVA